MVQWYKSIAVLPLWLVVTARNSSEGVTSWRILCWYSISDPLYSMKAVIEATHRAAKQATIIFPGMFSFIIPFSGSSTSPYQAQHSGLKPPPLNSKTIWYTYDLLPMQYCFISHSIYYLITMVSRFKSSGTSAKAHWWTMRQQLLHPPYSRVGKINWLQNQGRFSKDTWP